MAYAIDRLQRVELGRCGENLARRVAIDASTWLGRWPGARLEVLCHRPTESALYIPETLLDGAVLLWTVTAADTAFPGTGRGEVRALLGDVVVKSAVFDTVITPALEGTAGDPPAAGADWATDVIQAADRAEAASKQAVDAKLDAEAAAEQAEENVRTALQEAKDSGEFDGAPGEDGYTPIKGVDYFDGAPGTSGVYLGKEAPTDESVNVWIDPEGGAYYPIATRETLGGVKVGDGLTVDETGVLGVKPEGNWERIETITLSEAANKIVRTKFPNGTAFNLSAAKVIVNAFYPIAAPIGTRVDFITNGVTIGRVVQTIGAFNNSTTTHCSTVLYQAKPVSGAYEFIGAYGTQGSAMSMFCPPNGNYQAAPTSNKITQIDCVTWQNSFPAGTYIEIWGVRADA